VQGACDDVRPGGDLAEARTWVALMLYEHSLHMSSLGPESCFNVQGPAHAAMHDLVVLLAETRNWVAPTQYESFHSRMWLAQTDPVAAAKPPSKDAYR